MTPPEQSADKLADRLAEAAEAVLRCYWDERQNMHDLEMCLAGLREYLAAYREAKRASPKEPNLLASKTADSSEITDTQRLGVPQWATDAAKHIKMNYLIVQDHPMMGEVPDGQPAAIIAKHAAMLQNRTTCG